jgi:hypothetical protein
MVFVSVECLQKVERSLFTEGITTRDKGVSCDEFLIWGQLVPLEEVPKSFLEVKCFIVLEVVVLKSEHSVILYYSL